MKKRLQFEQATDHETIALQVAPLVDIVLFLICFFMLASEMVGSQKDPAVSLPHMSSPLAESETPAEVTVNLRADGAITVDGRVVALDRVPALVSGQAGLAGRDGRPLRVVVRADRQLLFAALDDVLVACRKAGLGQVIFRATAEEPQ
jgi:biopolymer transport protein ExbD